MLPFGQMQSGRALFSGFHRFNADARHWQILALSGLFCLSHWFSDFGASFAGLAAALSGTMLAQLAGTAWVNWKKTDAAPWHKGFQWKSALITSLSLSILLRANDPWVWFAAGLIAIGAKFLIRYEGKHIFNPACIGIVFMSVVLGPGAWVSPGQWGQAPLFAAFAIGAAALVLSSAKRLDIALGFLFFYAAMLIGRALYLGDPIAIPMHQMQSGALLVFAFFMITDPRSTPDSRAGRILFAACIAALAAWMGWQFHIRGAVLYALALLAPLTILSDHILPAGRFEWKARQSKNYQTQFATQLGTNRR